jgi:hypothetical protein
MTERHIVSTACQQVAWNVYLNGKLINTVFYTPNCDKDYVLDGLINHDGYDPAITIRRQ